MAISAKLTQIVVEYGLTERHALYVGYIALSNTYYENIDSFFEAVSPTLGLSQE